MGGGFVIGANNVGVDLKTVTVAADTKDAVPTTGTDPVKQSTKQSTAVNTESVSVPVPTHTNSIKSVSTITSVTDDDPSDEWQMLKDKPDAVLQAQAQTRTQTQTL